MRYTDLEGSNREGATMTEQVDRAKLAAKIQKLLAQAEGEAAAGNEAARDTLLEKASALQLKYAIEDAMVQAQHGATADKIVTADFCTESNTPLIKAKRQLINELAILYRGKAVMLGEWKKKRDGGSKYDKRAKVRVWAHQSDLDFITALYNSLIIQMQTMMANDEREDGDGMPRVGVPPAWRVSYAYGWVARVVARLQEAKQRTEGAAETSTPGTALVLRDRAQLVTERVIGLHPNLRQTSYRVDDKSEAGRAAGRAAADCADLGHQRVQADNRPRLQA